MTLTKKILLGTFAATIAFSGASFAATSGLYAGVQAGWSNTNPPSEPGVSIDGKGAAFGLRAGYQFTPHFALEGGYTRFAKTKFSVPGFASATLNYNVFDLVGKGIYSFDNGFGLYGKAGVAYMKASANANVLGFTGSAKDSATRPVAGLGVKYDFNQNVSADIGVTRIFKGGKLKQNANTVMVGLTYNFG